MNQVSLANQNELPETVVDNCPETGEDKLSRFDLDLGDNSRD